MTLTLHTTSGSFQLGSRYSPADLVELFSEAREARPLSFELLNGNTLTLYWREGCDWGIESDGAAPA